LIAPQFNSLGGKAMFVRIISSILTLVLGIALTNGLQAQSKDSLESKSELVTWQKSPLGLEDMSSQEWNQITYSVRDPHYLFLITVGVMIDYSSKSRVVVRYTNLSLIREEDFLDQAPFFYIDFERVGDKEGRDKFNWSPTHMPEEDWQPETWAVFQNQRWFNGCPEEIKRPLFRAMRAISQLMAEKKQEEDH